VAKDPDDLATVERTARGRAQMRANQLRKQRRQPSPRRRGVSGSPKGPNPNRGVRFDEAKGVRVSSDGAEWPICGDPRVPGPHGCKNFAGQGTGHPGYGKCRRHGGTSETHERKWAQLMAEEEMLAMTATLGAPIEVAPAQALLWCVHITAGHVAWLHARIGETPEEQIVETETRALIALYNGERERLARFSKMATDAGANEAIVKWTATQANALIHVCQEALSAIPNLTQDQVEAFLQAVAHGLGSLEGMSPDEVTARFNPVKGAAVLGPAVATTTKPKRRRHKIADDPRQVVPHIDP
jgi:hypothetical protein